MAIKVEINRRNLELSDRLEEHLLKKVDKLDRFLNILETATVDLSYVDTARNAQDRQVAQITVRGKGVMLRAEERSDDIFASLDAAVDKLLRQIKKYKGKHWNRRGDGRTAADVAPDLPTTEHVREEGPQIVRRKRFLLQPMDEQEALEQMELLGHENFFVYLDGQSGRVNVLYRRRDDSFGLIETDIA